MAAIVLTFSAVLCSHDAWEMSLKADESGLDFCKKKKNSQHASGQVLAKCNGPFNCHRTIFSLVMEMGRRGI